MSIFLHFFLLIVPYFSHSTSISPLGATFNESDLMTYGWQYTPDSPINYLPSYVPHITTCPSGQTLFGGPNIFGPYYYVFMYTTFGVPPHYTLSYSLNLVMWGNWDSTSKLPFLIPFPHTLKPKSYLKCKMATQWPTQD